MTNTGPHDNAVSTVTASVTEPVNPVFDTRYVTYVFNQRGFYVNEFAARLDLSNSVVEAFLRGDVEPGELRLATLLAMANLLGIPLRSMFTGPPTTTESTPLAEEGSNPNSASNPSVIADAEQLVATLYDTGRATPTLISDIANAFGWTTDQTYTAATEATHRLAPAGLRVNTSHGELFITPTNDHLDAQQALAARRTYERGLNYTHYKAVHEILNGNQVTVNKAGRQRQRTLGGLANTGILTQAKNPTLTTATQTAFLTPDPTTPGETP